MQQEERDGLQLGVFMPNCSNMYAISTYRSGPDEWPYESNKRIALAAEAEGFDSYYEDTVRFGQEIAPLLRQMGVIASSA